MRTSAWRPSAKLLAKARQKLLRHGNNPLAIAWHQANPGPPIDDVGDIHCALMGYRVFELRPGDVDALRHRPGRALAGGGGDDVGRLGAVTLHQRQR